jgi:preprotein translocase subunit SecD
MLLASCSSRQEPVELDPPARLEIRLAQYEPQAGFTPTTVEGSQDTIYLSSDVVLSNDHIREATYVLNHLGSPAIEILFTDEGTAILSEFTAAHIEQNAAIVMDGRVVTAPVIKGRIGEGRAVITGSFTEAEVKRLAKSIVTKP